MTHRARWGALVALVSLVVAACSNSTLPHHAGSGASQNQQLAAGTGGSVTTAPEGAAGASALAGGGATGSFGGTGGASSGGSSAGASSLGGGGGSTGATTGGAPSGTTGSSAIGGTSIGVTRNSITITASAPFSGVYGTLVNHIYSNGVDTWQKEINANGGINGRQVIIQKVDNMASADGAIAACKTAKTNGSLLVLNFIGAYEAEDDCEDAAGIPVVDDNPAYLHPWHNVIAGNIGSLLVPTEVSFLKSHYMNAGTKNVGVIYDQDVERYASAYDALVPELKKQGMKLVHTEKIISNQTTFVSEMSRMKGANAQLVMMYVGLEGPGILRDARAIGYSPQWYAAAISGAVSDIGAKSGGQEFQGIMGTRVYTTTETPAFARFVATVRKYQGDAAAAGVTDIDLPAFAVSDFLGHVLQQAGPNVTRESFLAAAWNTDHYDSGYVTPFTLKGRTIPVTETALFPVQCCKSDYTWRTIGPYGEQF